MLFRNPRAMAFVLITFGLGLAAFYGEQWYRLPSWSETEIEQSVELNLELDLQRLGPHLQPTPERRADLRRRIRNEIEAEIRREREDLQRWVGLGLVLIVFGAGQLVFALGVRR